MSISATFANALSGLTATRRLADVTANNLANALTEGYGRQSVDLSSAVLEGRGVGVSVTGVSRASAPDITAARRKADGDAATFGAQASALERLGRSLGEATDEDSLFVRLEEFEAGLRALADTPESGPRQTQTVEAAKDLVQRLNNLSQEAATVRANADGEIAKQVQTVNRNLARIDELNATIVRLGAGGRDVATLIDERERLIDEVSASIPARVHLQDDGSVFLTTTSGLFLLQEQPADLQFTPSPIITAPMTYDPAGTGALSGLTLAGIDITPSNTHPQRLTEGGIAGNFIVRDDIGTEFDSRIDQFAADLIARFEDPAVDPTLAAGDPGLFTDGVAALDLTIVEGLAGRIAVNALADPAQGGDPTRLRDGLQSAGPGPAGSDTIPRALLDTLTAGRPSTAIPGLVGNLSAAQMISGITEATGIRRTSAEAELASLTGARETIALTEAREIGVDTDAELQELIQIEQAFAANIQVIQAASRMLEQITEIR
ncbi:MAG: flagellar hook-associated protein FlgK [Pseudomonadota bacterium]